MCVCVCVRVCVHVVKHENIYNGMHKSTVLINAVVLAEGLSTLMLANLNNVYSQ